MSNEYSVNKDDLTAVADAIRTKAGTSDPLVFPDGYVSAVEGIQAGGGDIDALMERSLTEITSNAGFVAGYAFYNNTKIVKVSFPKAEYFGVRSNFEGCTKLTDINFPKVRYMSGQYAFRGCSSLEKISFPSMTATGDSTFRECKKLTDVDLPIATNVDSYAFYGCEALKKIVLPSLAMISSEGFRMCYQLGIADLCECRSIGNSAFSNCYSLKSVILRSERQCNLKNTNAFKNCYHFNGTVHTTYNPDGLKDGYIYVPSALVEAYKADSTWSTFADRFRALEDYTIDGTITGELRDLGSYTITVNKSACSIDNSATTIEEGSAYSATITGVESQAFMFRRDADFSVTMGGTDITANVVSHDSYPCLTLNINIPSVTGDIVINAYAN